MLRISRRRSGQRLSRVRLVLTICALYGLTRCSEPPDGSRIDSGGSQGSAGVGGSDGTGGAGTSGGSIGTGGTGILIDASPGDGGEQPGGPCRGLECQQTTCTLGNCTVPPCMNNEPLTTVSGTVYEPAGTIPIYNAVVYVPNGPVPEFTDGASCDRCDASIANPVAATLTDTHGNFTLVDVPVGNDIPLVIQVGKWRRQITIPAVTACVDNPLTDPNLTRLPRNKSEGDIPRIAIATGGADSMECLPRRMGIDDAEFTTSEGDGRIHLFRGNGCGMGFNPTSRFADTLNDGAELTPATDLWNSAEALSAYDMVILSCEGCTNGSNKPMSAREALYEYASTGGRVFASHWQRIWFSHGPDPVPEVARWRDREDPQNPAVGLINTTFPKGEDFADWLVNVMASTTPGEIEIQVARDNVQAVNAMHSTEWIRLEENEECTEGCRNNDSECIMDCQENPAAIELMTFNTPLNVPDDQKCGRVVYNDLHVSETGTDEPGDPFPEGCDERELTAQEKAVMFMLFDLSSCIQNDKEPPRPPVVQ